MGAISVKAAALQRLSLLALLPWAALASADPELFADESELATVCMVSFTQAVHSPGERFRKQNPSQVPPAKTPLHSLFSPRR